MKKFLCFILSILSSIIVIVAPINYYVDPSYVYHSEAAAIRMVECIQEEGNVTNIQNCDERAFKRDLAINLYNNKTIDYLILGASRVMTISEKSLRGYTVLNLGVSAAQVEDFESFFQICEENNISYNNVIIGIDPTMFNNADARWRTNIDYYNKYNEVKDIQYINFNKLTNIISPTYFQSAIQKHTIFDLKTIITTKEVEGIKSTYHRDGSLSYGREYREREQIIIDNEALTWIHPTFIKHKQPSVLYKRKFKNLLLKFKERNAKIIFYYVPYHPIFFKRICGYSIYKNGYAFINEIADRMEIRTIGDFNPQNVNSINKDFYDAAHPRSVTVDRILIDLNK